MNPIALASGVMPEFGPLETIAAADIGGFDGVGLWIELPKWDAALLRAAKAALDETGLALIDVEVIWLKPGLDDPDHFRCLDIGGALGARNALVVSSDPDMGANAAKLARLCAHARPMNIRVALEFGLFTEVKTLEQALALIGAVDDPVIALLPDTLHWARSGGAVEGLRAAPRELIAYAQICDAPAQGPARDDAAGIIREAVDERLQTGEGGLDVAGFVRALPADIPLSVELRSKPLRDAYPDPNERAKATAAATRRFLGSLT